MGKVLRIILPELDFMRVLEIAGELFVTYRKGRKGAESNVFVVVLLTEVLSSTSHTGKVFRH